MHSCTHVHTYMHIYAVTYYKYYITSTHTLNDSMHIHCTLIYTYSHPGLRRI